MRREEEMSDVTIDALRMTDRVSPLTIRLMLSCYYSPNPEIEIGNSIWNSQSGEGSREWLMKEGLINEQSKATERGKAWVEYICHTPLPIQQWILPRRSEIEL
jgi:hypothetical protein